MYFVDIEKAFDRVGVGVGKKKEKFTKINCKCGESLYHGAKIKVNVASELFKECLVQVGAYQGSVLSPLLFAITMNLTTENAREALMNEILYADDSVLINESIENLKEKFLKWKKSFDSKGLKVVMSGSKVKYSS